MRIIQTRRGRITGRDNFFSRGIPPTNQIQSPGLQRRIAEFLQIKEGSPAPTLGQEIQPVLVVGDLTNPQKQDATRWCSDGFLTNFPVAPPLGAQALQNPAGSGILIELKTVMISPNPSAYATQAQIMWGVNQGQTSIAAGFTPEFRSKYNAGFPRAKYHSGTTTDVITAMGYAMIGNSVNYVIPCEGIIIPPGYYFEWTQNYLPAVASGAAGHMIWTETDEAR